MRLTKADAYAVARVAERMRPVDRDEVFALRWDDDQAAFINEVVHSYGPFKYVAWDNDGVEPICVFGANLKRQGVYCAYMFATEEFPLIGLPVTRFIKRELIPVIERTGAHRCEAWSSAAHFWAHRWLAALGATKEATLRRLGRDGEDFHVFRWDSNVRR